MHPAVQKFDVTGPAGKIEGLLDFPSLAPGVQPQGVAFIAHPHPLFGGTMQNKVAQALARAHAEAGWMAVRFNFRGVGASEGHYDQGLGEMDDMLAVIRHFAPQGALALAGFSFGAFIASRAVAALSAERPINSIVLVGTAAGNFDVAPIPAALHARTLVVHGETDDTIALPAVLDWARPQNLPVMVLPGVGHFFHGQLIVLRHLISRHLMATIMPTTH
jgi:uncharacterized protein